MNEDDPFHWLKKSEFAKNPVIDHWMNDCLARGLNARTMRGYHSTVKFMFKIIPDDPAWVVSSKQNAIEFWRKFSGEYRKKWPHKGTQAYRTNYRSLLASHDITFAPRAADVYGLSAKHDNFGGHAGVSLSPEIISEIGNMMLKDDKFLVFVWFRIALRTAARHKAISRLTWDHIHIIKNPDGSELFKLESHETKDRRGQKFLGEDGEWKIKYPPRGIKDLLLKLRELEANSPFVFFKDGGSDVQNRRNAKRIADQVMQEYKFYYSKIIDRLDVRTREYVIKRPTHILRHTFAQLLKNSGLTENEIAVEGGWRSAAIVSSWYSDLSEKQRKDIGDKAGKVDF